MGSLGSEPPGFTQGQVAEDSPTARRGLFDAELVGRHQGQLQDGGHGKGEVATAVPRS